MVARSSSRRTPRRACARASPCAPRSSSAIGRSPCSSPARTSPWSRRSTQPQGSDQLIGRGIDVGDDPASGERGRVTLLASLVEANHDVGLIAIGSDATIEATLVRGTQPTVAEQRFGEGIHIQYNPDTSARSVASIRACVVEGSRQAGVGVVGSDALFEWTVIESTQPSLFNGAFGDGVAIDETPLGASATFVACRIAGSARAGIASFGAEAVVGQTVLQCNAIHLDGENPYIGADYSFDDLGGNACGCAGEAVACKVLSSNLTPPEPISAAG